MPLPTLEIPADVPVLADTPAPTYRATAQPRPDGLPFMGWVNVPKKGMFGGGSRVTIGAAGLIPTRVGLYGPNPAKVDGSVGVLGTPKDGSFALKHFDARNVKAGRYLLVIWGDGGTAVSGPVDYTLQFQAWKVF